MGRKEQLINKTTTISYKKGIFQVENEEIL
jgi:hypothetical protein